MNITFINCVSRNCREYKDRFGRCETESAPFECKICGKVIKYDRQDVGNINADTLQSEKLANIFIYEHQH